MTAVAEEYLEVPEAFYRSVFSKIWKAALLLAVCFGASATIWPQYDKPLIAVPLVTAAAAGLVLGWIGAGRNREELVREFTSNFWLRLTAKQETITAVDLFEQMVPDLRDRRKVYRLQTSEGSIYVLHVQRFVELLVSRTMNDISKAAEHAIAVAWHRSFGELRPDLVPILDKAFREAFKGDLSGNVISSIARAAENLVQELGSIAEPKDISLSEPFKLEAMTPFSPMQRSRGRPRR